METKDFGYIPDTSWKDIRAQKDINVSGLYYLDDDDNKTTPVNVWFSCDSRNWRQDEKAGPGRCYTMYLSRKGGTCLAPVYLPSGEHYILTHLCNVSGDYKNGVITNFCRE